MGKGLSCCGDRKDGGPDLSEKLSPPPLCGVIGSFIFVFCFVCISVSFYLSPAAFLCCFAVIAAVSAMAMAEGSAWKRGYPSTVLIPPIALVSIVIAFVAGVKIYVKSYSPYKYAISGYQYENVPPNARADEFADAGIVHFSDDATLDTTRAFGFKASDFTYCVAPIVSTDETVHPLSHGPKITFWAVGRDCCGNRGNFECDGATDTDVRSAFVMQDYKFDPLTSLLVPHALRPRFLQAISAAQALHNLQVPDDPENVILLRWATDPESILNLWLSRSILGCALSCGIYSVVISALWCLVHRYIDDQVRKAGKELSDSQGEVENKGNV